MYQLPNDLIDSLDAAVQAERQRGGPSANDDDEEEGEESGEDEGDEDGSSGASGPSNSVTTERAERMERRGREKAAGAAARHTTLRECLLGDAETEQEE